MRRKLEEESMQIKLGEKIRELRKQLLPKEATIFNIIQSIILKMNAGKKRYLYWKKFQKRK